MKKTLFLLVSLVAMAVSCQPEPAPTPLPPTPTPIPPTAATVPTATVPQATATTVLPTPTLAKSTPTYSPTLTPTTTPTQTPRPPADALAAADDLQVWIDDYVHAYGGTLTYNGVKMDADQLGRAVKANPGSFIERKTIKGSEQLFFVVDGVPLGIKSGSTWRAILARDLSDAVNAQFAMPVASFQMGNANFLNAVKNANTLTMTWDMDNAQIFGKWTTADWRNILDHWDTIKPQLDAQQIPSGLAYNWLGADLMVELARANHMGIRAQHLIWCGDVQDSIRHGGFTKAELLKIIEFTVSVRLIKYKGVISEWDAEDEMKMGEFGTDEKWSFWQIHVGIWDATRLSATLIRKIDPQVKITITEDHTLEKRWYNLQPDLGIRFLEFIKTLKQEGLVDKVDIENNLWVYDLPEQAYMENYLRQIQALGIELAAPEITVCPSKEFLTGPGPRQVYEDVDDPLKALAEGYRRTVQAYIDVGGYDIGLGEVGDETSTYNWMSPGTYPALFDMQWKPKMAYYEVLRVMYDGFFNKIWRKSEQSTVPSGSETVNSFRKSGEQPGEQDEH